METFDKLEWAASELRSDANITPAFKSDLLLVLCTHSSMFLSRLPQIEAGTPDALSHTVLAFTESKTDFIQSVLSATEFKNLF